LKKALAWFVAVLAVGCLVGGCGDPDGPPDEARVMFEAYLKPPLAIESLRLTVNDGEHTWHILPSRFTETYPGDYKGPTLDTKLSGMLLTHVEFLAPGDSAVMAEGDLPLPLRADWIWQVMFDAARPQFWLGQIGVKAFALKPAYRTADVDSVYVEWTGNYIRHPVIY
jgi:hypothetical protein